MLTKGQQLSDGRNFPDGEAFFTAHLAWILIPGSLTGPRGRFPVLNRRLSQNLSLDVEDQHPIQHTVSGNRTVINCRGPEGRLCSVTMYEVLFCFSKRQKPPSDAAAVPAFKYFGDVLASIPKRALGKHQEITEPFRLEKSSDITESKLCPSPPCPQPRALSPGQLQGPQTSPGSPFQCPASLFMWGIPPEPPWSSSPPIAGSEPDPIEFWGCHHILHPAFQGSDSEYEVDPGHQKGISRAQAYSYTESDSGEPEHTPLSNSTSTQQSSLFRPKASRTPTPQTPGNAPSSQPGTLYCPPSSLAPGSRAPIAGFSSFV
ncbi:uncharacterized protein LOC117007383 [Catharus ustulatus]|uniref:uncharacterized protein LOC117007383 n=1 Tax=Catharus ustulatus TaxID=91951 RepID=UPI0014074665|nr:uncharacterized protein LOC117007383 [Catharus ustulatus]XP_032936400.1 uncharacterized protein LOC117007383 [Catharus ustulatus]XP_032936401.1 uncharacterized protein LOC117007383 [Catharus ustulatus]XP_032936402.1 uncharacterized protein LOC117007383 [Catharus ustulatus]